MNDQGFRNRLAASARDFIRGVQPSLEKRLRVTIHPIEQFQNNELVQKLDHAGIDGFYFDRENTPHCLASRMNYARAAAREPWFSFRYSLFDDASGNWDDRREFAKKCSLANAPQNFALFPKLHVESFSQQRGSGRITWSFAAETAQVIRFIHMHFENEDMIRFFEPRQGERRRVVAVPIRVFAKHHEVIEIGTRA